MKQLVLWILLLEPIIQGHGRCPNECHCDIMDGKKSVVCDKGGMNNERGIPVYDMDRDVNVLIVTSPPDNPNFLKLGHIFERFTSLQEVTITHSNIPGIGDDAFWQVGNLTLLNLSHNNITRLVEKNFNRLSRLITLDLSDNNIDDSPSAVFGKLKNLKHLSLARNKFKELAPRLFFRLEHLESLDLSGNKLDGFKPEHIQDLLPLKRLNFSNCSLSSLNSTTYMYLPNLEEFNLRYNKLTTLRANEFRLLKILRVLNLDHNFLTAIENDAFSGHKLTHLSLSHNALNDIQPCAFCNMSVVHLDLSDNQIGSLPQGVLMPLKESLISLDLSYNRIPAKFVSGELSDLPNLRLLSLAGCEISQLPPDMFSSNHHLQKIDLSHNLLFNFSDSDINSLYNLTVLDLSSNKIRTLKNNTLISFEEVSYVYLDGNPWSCTLCDMMDVLLWVNTSSVYRRSCEAEGRCAECSTPVELLNRNLESLQVEELGSCVVPHTGSMVSLPINAQLGIIITVCVVAVLLVVVIIVLLFRYHGAVYYTHEEERSEDGDKTSLTNSSVGFGDDKKPVFIATIGKIDERLEEKSSDKNTIG